MAITARSEIRSSGIVDLEQVLIHFTTGRDRSVACIAGGISVGVLYKFPAPGHKNPASYAG